MRADPAPVFAYRNTLAATSFATYGAFWFAYGTYVLLLSSVAFRFPEP